MKSEFQVGDYPDNSVKDKMNKMFLKFYKTKIQEAKGDQAQTNCLPVK